MPLTHPNGRGTTGTNPIEASRTSAWLENGARKPRHVASGLKPAFRCRGVKAGQAGSRYSGGIGAGVRGAARTFSHGSTLARAAHLP